MEVEPDADFGPLERVALGVDSRKNGATVHGLLKPLDVKEREARFKLREDRSDVIVPAAEIFLRACAYLKCDVITVPNISLADAIVDGLYERLLT